MRSTIALCVVLACRAPETPRGSTQLTLVGPLDVALSPLQHQLPDSIGGLIVALASTAPGCDPSDVSVLVGTRAGTQIWAVTDSETVAVSAIGSGPGETRAAATLGADSNTLETFEPTRQVFIRYAGRHSGESPAPLSSDWPVRLTQFGDAIWFRTRNRQLTLRRAGSGQPGSPIVVPVPWTYITKTGDVAEIRPDTVVVYRETDGCMIMLITAQSKVSPLFCLPPSVVRPVRRSVDRLFMPARQRFTGHEVPHVAGAILGVISPGALLIQIGGVIGHPEYFVVTPSVHTVAPIVFTSVTDSGTRLRPSAIGGPPQCPTIAVGDTLYRLVH